LRRPVETARFAAEAYAEQFALIGATASMSRTGDSYDCESMRAA